MNAATKKLTFDEQADLIQHCIRDGVELDDVLASLQLDYNSLRYRHSTAQATLFDDAQIVSQFRTLADFEPAPHQVPVVSFFSGAGGLDLGFEAAGFHHLASIEINELACETLRKNRASWAVLGPPLHSGDICNREEYTTLLRQQLGIKTPFEGVFHGGPPCQSFSIAANQRFAKGDENFKRTGFSSEQYGNLLFDYIWYIQEFLPRAFLIENVAGLLEMDGGKQLTLALNMLRGAGYEITTPTVINAADYGVPQNRLRVFVLGTRKGTAIALPPKNAVSVPCQAALAAPLHGVQNHLTRQHKADSVVRYMELRYGQRDAAGRVDRLDPRFASKTVIAGGTKGGGRSHLHPEIPRTLSVRECARLQTFPDDYVFYGPSARQFTQVGNAVPPLLAMRIAAQIYSAVYA